MENASKALIIAGSILISILIVGLGVIIYNNVKGVTDKSSMSQIEINAHNSPFESYFGNSVAGTNVRALITSVNANNNQASVDEEEIGNKIFLIDSSNAAVTASSIRTGRTYNVNLPDNDNHSDEDKAGDAYWKNGYIKTIVITANT